MSLAFARRPSIDEDLPWIHDSHDVPVYPLQPTAGIANAGLIESLDTPLWDAVNDLCTAIAGGKQACSQQRDMAGSMPLHRRVSLSRCVSYTPFRLETTQVLPAISEDSLSFLNANFDKMPAMAQQSGGNVARCISFDGAFFDARPHSKLPNDLPPRAHSKIMKAPRNAASLKGHASSIYHTGVQSIAATKARSGRSTPPMPGNTISRRKEAKPGDLKCPLCPAVFSRRDLIKRHVDAIHNDIRKFECNICGSRFKRSDNLRMHIRRHERRNEEQKQKAKSMQPLEKK